MALLLAGCTMSRHAAQGGWAEQSAAPIGIQWPARERSVLEAQQRTGRSRIGAPGSNSYIELTLAEFIEPCGEGWIRATALLDAQENRSVLLSSDFDFACWHPGSVRIEVTAAGDEAARKRLAEVLEGADYRHTFRLLLPEREPLGLAIHGFSMGDVRREQAVMEALRRRGWAVLYTTRMSAYLLGRDPDAFERRETDPHTAFRLVEGMLEEFIASYAYANDAAVQFVRQHVPALRDTPIIIAGFSFGALMAPTLAARLGDDVAAVVLVGGGADLPRIAAESTFNWSWHPMLRGRLLSARDYRVLRDEYRARTNLDPYATAPLLRNRPVLVVQARWDRIVPARYGDLLWERLGRPERWMFRGGHLMLFWRLEKYADPIARWAHEAALGHWGGGAPRGSAGEEPSHLEEVMP
jgi:pimeloyl-ACP methyl ester carboxylesterase